MSDAFNSTYFAMDSRLKTVDIIANNLANAQTTGFKSDFGQVLKMTGNVDVKTSSDLSQGDMMATHNDLDAAIAGEGFFAVETPGGVRYTRAGNFAVSESGDLTTKDGAKVLSSSGSPINVSGGSASIQNGGSVTVNGTEVATLRVVTFRDPQLLKKEGAQRFQWTGATEDVLDVPEPNVKAGHLEQSNTNATEEMVHLMTAYRDFEAMQRAMKTFSEMNSRLIQEMGKLT